MVSFILWLFRRCHFVPVGHHTRLPKDPIKLQETRSPMKKMADTTSCGSSLPPVGKLDLQIPFIM